MVTVIVLLILAGVSLNAIIGENGIIANALDARLLSQYSTYKEEMEIHLKEKINVSGEKMKEYMSSMKTEDINNFVVLNGKLYFIGTDEYERKIAEKVGINTTLGGKEALPEDIIQIVGEILPKKDEVKLPENDKDETPEELPGKRLYTKNTENDTKWDMVMDYNESSEETGRWGSGYYLLTKGEYEIDGKTITLKKDYIIDYRNNELMGLSERYEDWNINSTLGTTTGLVLNLDPSNFENYLDDNGELDNIKMLNDGINRYGDVSYNKDNRSLDFNLSGVEPDSGYLEISKSFTGEYLDFSNGFTFEIFLTFKSFLNDNQPRGIFCRKKSLNQGDYRDAMRFMCGQPGENGLWGKLCRDEYVKGVSSGVNMHTTTDGIFVDNSPIELDKPVSISFEYSPEIQDEIDDSLGDYSEDDFDEVILSIDGDKYRLLLSFEFGF